MAAPYFIVGTQRSGTTLLFRMLDSHPQLTGVNEFWNIHPHIASGQAEPDQIQTLVHAHLGVPKDGQLGGSPSEVLDAQLLRLAASRGKRRWGLKDPRTTYFLDAWRNAYPLARFIFIVRDPRAVVRSYLQNGVVANAFCGAELWAKETALQEQFQAAAPDLSHLIKYEELVRDPSTVLHRACEFLEEPFAPEMLEYHRQPMNTSLNPLNKEVTKPLATENAEKWRAGLSAATLGRIECRLSKEMGRYGYDPSCAPMNVGPLAKLGYQCHDWVVREYRWQRRSKLRGVRRKLGIAGRTLNE